MFRLISKRKVNHRDTQKNHLISFIRFRLSMLETVLSSLYFFFQHKLITKIYRRLFTMNYATGYNKKYFLFPIFIYLSSHVLQVYNNILLKVNIQHLKTLNYSSKVRITNRPTRRNHGNLSQKGSPPVTDSMLWSGEVGDNSASLWYISRISSRRCLWEKKSLEITLNKEPIEFSMESQSVI